MADPKTSLERLIEEHGGVLVRQKKHKVYRFPNGATFTVASTPECPLAYDNALAFLKTLLGVHSPNRGTPGERREKRPKRKPVGSGNPLPFRLETPAPEANTWKEKLAVAAIQLTPPEAKRPVTAPPRRLSFEERMIRAGVRKLEE
jgi:hypothetical protein